MSTRFLLPIVLLAASALLFAACKDEGKFSAEVTVRPAATETEAAGPDTGGDGPGAVDPGGEEPTDGGAEPTVEGPGVGETTTPEVGGSGTIAIGQMVFAYEVTTCSVESDGSAVASGVGETADGRPFFAEARVNPGGVGANANVNVGVDSLEAQGSARWQGVNVTDAEVSTDDGLSLSFTTPFIDAQAFSPVPMTGTVDVTCQ